MLGRSALEEGHEVSMERGGNERQVAGSTDVVDVPPPDFVEEFAVQGLPVQGRGGFESFAHWYEMDLLALSVPETVDEGYPMLPVPDVGSDVHAGEADFLVQFASQCVERSFVGVDASSWKGPARPCGKFEANEQHVVSGSEDHRPCSGPDAQRCREMVCRIGTGGQSVA